MNRDDYEFTKRVGREAYEQAIRDMEAIGGGGQPITDQHRHPDYSLVDHDHNADYADKELFEEHLANHPSGGGVPEEHEHPHEHEELQAQVDHNEDRINALEHELEALADTKEAGEWELVSLLDFDIRGSGQMLLNIDNFTASTNNLTLHNTDTEGLSHSFSRVEVGDYVEIVEEHPTRGVGDYGLYVVKSKSGNEFELVLEQGRGTATYKSHFIVKFFHLNDNLDLTDLDNRYAFKSHPHSDLASKEYVDTELGKKANTHSHPYASSSHTHSTVPSHTHDYSASNHTHSVIFRSGTTTNPSLSKGEPFLNTTYKVIYVGT